jgi:hypothetical protein
VTDVGDGRLTTRCGMLVDALGARPESSVPHACASWAVRKAASRLWRTPRVTPEAIRQGHVARTRERMGRETSLILASEETTSLTSSTHPATTGLGPLPGATTAGTPPQGMLAHAVLAVNDQGVPLGRLHQEVWARSAEEPETDLTPEEKEAKKKPGERRKRKSVPAG